MGFGNRVSCAALGSAVLVMALGCASASAAIHPRTASESANDIRVEEIRPILWRVHTASEVIRLLRPAMLTERESGGAYYVDATRTSRPHHLVVYVDDMLVGDVDVLTTIPAKAVLRVRRLTPSEATTRYGTMVASDVIAITTYPASTSTRSPRAQA